MTPPVTPVPEDMSVLTLISDASLPAQLVMLILVIVSITSWAFIISKYLTISRTMKQTREFEQNFWRGGDLSALHQSVSRNPDQSGALARIFDAGMNEFLKSRSKAASPEAQIEGAERAMQATYQREIDALDAKLSFLASAGSVSPYVGLLGTVWGIMHSFLGLSTNATATLAAVAPGIAEALIATAIGLFAAIPAVLAYNYFSNAIDKAASRFDSFMDEFLNILQRQAK
ncbi:protein TolQ [Pelistega europaea]|uniref:Tol-Pal system protein TolQ n=1 Tax=Pelistega europaea TaxID=106147 RepID=A0A7Y4L8G0_9BURK|nr:protein TolQ [Pelistega europaea]NOL48818.1 protein TolQ [Pelistega europaea]